MFESVSLSDAAVGMFVGSSQLIFICGVFHATASADPKRLSRRICLTTLICWSTIVVVAVALGTISLLKPWLFYLCLSLFGVVCYRYGPPSENTPSAINAVPRRSRFWRRCHDVTWLIMSCLVLGHVLRYGVIRLPTDWDSLAYHVPLIDHWVQYQSLLPTDCAFWYVPGNNELLGYWLVAGYSGDFWVGLNNLPVLILLVTASVELMIELRIRWYLRILTIIGVAASTVFMRQAISQENDLAGGALAVSIVLFGGRWLQKQNRVDALGFCLSAGLLAGIKYYTMLYAVALTFVVIAYLGWRRGGRSVLQLSSALMGAVVLLAGYWYLRNWIFTGTPLFPKGFPVLGMPDLWGQMRPGNEFSTLVRGGTPERFRLLAWAWIAQAGPTTFVSVVLAPLAVLIGLWGKLSRNREMSRLVALCVAAAVFVYLNTPNVIESVFGTENMLQSQYHSVRFGTPLAVLVSIAFAAMIQQLPRPAWRIAGTSVLLLLLLGDVELSAANQLGFASTLRSFNILVFWPWGYPADPAITGLLAFDVLFLVIMLRGVYRFTRFPRELAGAGICGALVLSTYFVSANWHDVYDDHFGQIVFNESMQTITKPLGDDVRLCVCDYRYYPFLGSDRSRSVVRPLYLPDESATREFVAAARPTHLFTRHRDFHLAKSYEGVWPFVEGQPSTFKKLTEVGQFYLFKVSDETKPAE